MKETRFSVEYHQFSPHFQHCMLAECPRSASCLRFWAFTLVTPDTKSFSLLNPAHLKAQNLADCRYFCDHDPITYVTGLNGAAEKIPSATFQKIREELIGILGRSAYYRVTRREQWLDAQAQQRILAVFQSHDMEGHLVYDEVRQAY